MRRWDPLLAAWSSPWGFHPQPGPDGVPLDGKDLPHGVQHMDAVLDFGEQIGTSSAKFIRGDGLPLGAAAPIGTAADRRENQWPCVFPRNLQIRQPSAQVIVQQHDRSVKQTSEGQFLATCSGLPA